MISTLGNNVYKCAMDMAGVIMVTASETTTNLKLQKYIFFITGSLPFLIISLFFNRCDESFSGPDCQPSSPLPASLFSDFESQEELKTAWQEVNGGEVVTPDQGCGVVSSGSSMYFSKVWY